MKLIYSKLLIFLVFVLSISITEISAATTATTPTTTTASTDTYSLTVNSTPNILFISGSGMYDSGAVVTLQKMPDVWQDYQFVGWKIDGLWSDQNPPTILMTRSHDVEAVFAKQEGIGKILIDAIPRITEITVDGTIYLPDELPLSYDWPVGSTHTIVISDVQKQNPNSRYKFDSWKDLNKETLRTITVDEKTSNFVAIYKTQHFLKPISEYGTVAGGGWQDQGSSVSFELESDVVVDKKNENIRYVFNSWDLGDYLNSPNNIIDVEEPIAVKANWDEQYKLDLKTNIPDYNLFGTGWYNKERQVALIAEPTLESPNSDIQYVFDRWVSKGPNPVIIPNAQEPATTITMAEPYVIEANYKKAFLVNVWTPYSTGVGGGFHSEGSTVEISIAQPEVIVNPNKIKKIFSEWNSHGARIMDFSSEEAELEGANATGIHNVLVFVDGPTNVTAKWDTQYYLDVQSSEGTVKGSGWYDIGRMAQISAETPSIPAGMWSTQVFDKWVGDIDSTSMKDRVLMNKPKNVIAEWRVDNTPGIINSIILGGIVGVGILIYAKTRNGKLSSSNGKNNPSTLQRPFESFFNLRSRSVNPQQKTSPIIAKENRLKSILSWLLGREV